MTSPNARQAEEALRQANLVIENSPVVLFRWKATEGWPVVLVTRNVIQFGYRPEEFLSGAISYGAIVHPDDIERVALEVRKYSEEGADQFQQVYRIIARDGNVRWVDDRTTIERDASGTITHYQGIIIDITDRKTADRALENAKEQAEYEKRQAEIYLDLMGHDINNQHQICLGYLELALMSPDVGPGTREMIATAIKALNSSKKLIENVKKLRRMKEGSLDHHLIDVGKLLSDMLPGYSRASGRYITINYQAGVDSRVLANDLLEDVFSNIIGNAIKHSAGPVTINISLDRIVEDDKNWCRVSIEDDGPGIPDRMKEKLFTRFRKAGFQPDGTGLGLYLVKALVDDFGGAIRVEDRVPGDHSRGSRFVIELPAVVN